VRGSSYTGCAATDTVKVTVLQLPVISTTNDTSICSGDSVLLQATGPGIRSYQWMPATGLSSTSIYNPVASPTVSTKYFVRVTDSQNCRNKDSVFVYVEPNPVFDINPRNIAICDGDSVKLTASGGNNYKWSPTSSLTKPNSAATIAFPNTKTVYEVIVLNTICRVSDTLYSVVDINPPPVITI